MSIRETRRAIIHRVLGRVGPSAGRLLLVDHSIERKNGVLLINPHTLFEELRRLASMWETLADVLDQTPEARGARDAIYDVCAPDLREAIEMFEKNGS